MVISIVFVHLAGERVHLATQALDVNIGQPGDILAAIHDVQEVSKAFVKKNGGWNVGIQFWTIIIDLFRGLQLKGLEDLWFCCS